jgi:hypothetical protein
MDAAAHPMTAFLGARGTEAADLHPAEQPHDNLGPNFNVAIWILTGAAFVFLCLRLYCKIHIRRGLWWDDYVLILAMVSRYHSSHNMTETEQLSNLVFSGYARYANDHAVCLRPLRLREA